MSDYTQGPLTLAGDDARPTLDINQGAILATVLALANEPAPLLQATLYIHIYALPVGSDDVVERHAPELFVCVAERLLKRGVRLHDPAGFGVHEEDVFCSMLDDCMVEQLALLDRLLVLFALG